MKNTLNLGVKLNPNNQDQSQGHLSGQRTSASAGPRSDWQRQAMDEAGVEPGQPEGAGGNLPPVGKPDGSFSKKPVLLIAGAVVLIGVIVVLYLALSGGNGGNGGESTSVNEATEQSNESAASAVDMGTFADVSFVVPDMTGYTKQARSTENFSNYTAEDGKCAIGFGTLSVEEIPGSNTEEIISLQIDKLRDAGSTVDGPNSADALVVKDAADSSMAYRMPTLTFKLAKDDTRVSTRYSVAILGNGDRAIVNRECVDRQGNEIPENRMDELDAKARELTVTVTP